MDAVITDLEKRFLDIWKERYPKKAFIPFEERKTFYVADQYPAEEKSNIFEILTEKGLYFSLEPIPGSFEALNEMKEVSSVYICTSPLTSNPYCLQEKNDWVKKFMGTEWLQKLIITKDKTLVRGNYLIDDKPEITGLLAPTWEHIIFDQPYNIHIQNKRRISWDNWKEIYPI